MVMENQTLADNLPIQISIYIPIYIYIIYIYTYVVLNSIRLMHGRSVKQQWADVKQKNVVTYSQGVQWPLYEWTGLVTTEAGNSSIPEWFQETGW